MNRWKGVCVAMFGLSGAVSPLALAGEPLAEAIARAHVKSQVDQCGGENCAAVFRGLIAFVDGRPKGLGGNGRSCADCHLPSDNLQLSPASAQARFELLQWRRKWNPRAQDPLFLPIDADDFRINGEQASDFSNLLQNGLVRVTLPLPPNIRLIDPLTNAVSAETTADVWRMVPTVNDVRLTGADGANPAWPRRGRTRGCS